MRAGASLDRQPHTSKLVRCLLDIHTVVSFLWSNFTTPQPQNSDVPWVGIGQYSDIPSVGIDLCRHLFGVTESGIGIAYADRHVYSYRQSDALGAINTDK